jgi:hypothetical protein
MENIIEELEILVKKRLLNLTELSYTLTYDIIKKEMKKGKKSNLSEQIKNWIFIALSNIMKEVEKEEKNQIDRIENEFKKNKE